MMIRPFTCIIVSFMLLTIGQSTGRSATKDLVAAWAFDEGTGNTVKDVSGHGHNGTISGAKWVNGKFGKALEFNGDGDQVSVPNDDALNIQGALTIEAWIFLTGWNPDLNAIAQKWEDGSNRRQYQLTVYGQTKTNWWYCSNAGDKWPRAEGKILVEPEKWTHVAGTYDGKKLRNYTNGKFDVELDQPNGIFASDVPVVIGGYGPKTKVTYGQNRHFKGIIDEVRFWSKALTEKEIQDGMNSTVAPIQPLGKLATTWGDIKSLF
ncbi:LamG domain-containing protein [Candidatus Poribacteria bacterium]|nr:LamG domain-containing protein [Candidatus Poribacteria bacterium]